MQMELPASFAHDEEGKSTSRLIGLGVVVLLHVGLIYALVNGLGKSIVDAVQAPIETRILADSGAPPEDVAPPPPPPPLAPPPLPTMAMPEIVIEQPPPTPPVQPAVRKPPTTAQPHPPAAPHPSAPAVPDSAVSASPISGGRPTYPARMVEQEREGRVDLICDIDAQGVPTNCKVTNVVGGPDFAASALEWMRRVRYKPRIRNGVPVAEPRHALNVKYNLSN
jgi:periplasmic protein TonB